MPRSSLFPPSFLPATGPPISNSFCYPRRWSGVSLLALNPCSPNLKVSINWIKNQNHEPRSWFFLVCGLMPRCLGYEMIPNQNFKGVASSNHNPNFKKAPYQLPNLLCQYFNCLLLSFFSFFSDPHIYIHFLYNLSTPRFYQVGVFYIKIKKGLPVHTFDHYGYKNSHLNISSDFSGY